MGVKIDLKPGTDRRILGHVDQDGIQLETGEHVAINTIEINEIDAHHAPVVKPDTTIIYEDRIGESNYNKLDNLPSINSIVLTGNKTLEELGIQAAGDYATKDEIIKDASNINYKDNYGYGGENVQDALDVAFDTLDNTPNYSDLDNCVSYSIQSKITTQQKLNARNNIEALGTNNIKQGTGDSTTDVISQKGVTDLLNEKQSNKPNGVNLLISDDTGKID